MALEDMAAKGKAKLAKKAALMASKYEAAKADMIANYKDAGFGPRRCANYEAAIKDAEYHAPNPDKWYKHWLEAMKK